MTHFQLFRNLSFLLLALIVFSLSSSAQDATGRIVGNVTDPSGAPVEGAKVTVENIATKIAQETVTGTDGFYQSAALPIGNYRVSIEIAGFRRQVFEKQNLQINQSLRLDAKLAIGQQTQVVEVTDQAAAVETENQTIGASVVGETIQRAPLNGRNVLDLAALQPGVTETNQDSTATGKYSIAGGRSDSVTYLLDGALNNNLLDNSVVYNPNPDVVAEFRVLESNYSAEYGRNGGGVISVVTKSGSNDFHGSAFEFLRNDALNANTYFNNFYGLPRDVLKRHQFGGTVGGPIRKDKLFFFVGYQGQRLSAQNTSGPYTVFTPAQLQGDFSQSGTPGNGQPANCPNADTGVATFLQANPYFQSNAALAACAIVDPTKINAVSQKYIAAGFLPTDPSGQATYQGASTSNNNELSIKIDYSISDKDKLTATIGGFRNPQLNPFQFSTVPGFSDTGFINNYFLNGEYTRTISSNLVNEFRAYTQRANYLNDQPVGKLPTAADLGIGTHPDNPTGPPNLYFDNGLQVGYSEQGPTSEINNTFGFSDTVTWIRGHHTWKFGGGLSGYQNNTIYDYYVNGEFDFYAGGAGTDNSLADFILGIPSQYFQYPAAPSNIRSKSTYGFAQDEWRLTKNFTLNLGVRYEYSTPKLDTQGRTYSIIPGLQSQRFPDSPVGLVYPGDPGAPRGTNFPDKNDWAPRIGFAWNPGGKDKTSLRGGFGIFYDILKGEDNLQFNGQPPFFSSAGLTFPSVGPGQVGDVPYFTDPFDSAGVPDPFPSTPPTKSLNFAAAGFLPINAAGAVYFVDPHLRTPYTYQYNLSLQHEIFKNTVLEISYVGSSSHGLTGLQDVNPFVLGTTDRILNLTPGNSSCQDEDGQSTSGVTDPNQLCSFGSAPEFKNVSKASYNSLQASLTRQISDSFLGRTYFTLAYTFAHSIDNVSGFRERNSSVPSYEDNLFRASSDQDVRHRITFSGGWDLPFERAWSSGPRRLTEGWSVFPIVTWHTGFPYDVFANLGDRFVYNAEGPSGAGDPANVHANVVGSTASLNPRQAQDFGSGLGAYWINPNSFSNAQCPALADVDPTQPACVPGPDMLPANYQVVADPSLATYGTLPRNFLRGPGYINFDFEVSKTTSITERLKLEFRAEFFNIFNHANFQNPDTNINSSQFGQITTTGVGVQGTSTYDPQPRIIQLALRLSF
ncbi:MAG: TonB-dependent receptor [Candidatus Acidiferrum sp.]|jgi:hypothetical protein